MVSNLARLWGEDIREAADRARLKGEQRGEQSGIQKGRQEERMKIIRSLSGAGLPLDLISKTTETPVDEIKKILGQPS